MPGDARPIEQTCYAAGDLGFNLLWVLYDAFLLYFLSEFAHLPSSAITLIIICSRGADLIAGGLFGLFGDRVGMPSGNYRPYLWRLALPLSISFALLFSLPSLHVSSSLLVVAMVVTATIFSALYSVTNAAYTALLSVLSTVESVRVRVAALRFAFAAVGVLAVQYFALPLAVRWGVSRPVTGWASVGLLCAVLSLTLLWTAAAGTQERVPLATLHRVAFQRILRDLRHEPQYAWLLLAMVCCLAALSARGAASPFFIHSIAGHPEWAGIALAANSFAALTVCIVVPLLIPARWLRPFPLLCTCALLGSTACMLPGSWAAGSYAHLIVLQAAFGAGTGLLLPTLFALLAAPSTRGNTALTPALRAAMTLIALKCGSACGALLASSTVTRAGANRGAMLSSIAKLFTLWPALLFALTLFALIAAVLQCARPARPST